MSSPPSRAGDSIITSSTALPSSERADCSSTERVITESEIEQEQKKFADAKKAVMEELNELAATNEIDRKSVV